ncbi:MAG: hypothetical protein NVV74_12695 [Magnetospirillum sp.]|nr:hypothetical protein [Magnetospirillum sp.]
MPHNENSGSEEKAKTAKPGDQAPPGTEGTGEALCPVCSGTGILSGQPCPNCAGTGAITQGIGGA